MEDSLFEKKPIEMDCFDHVLRQVVLSGVAMDEAKLLGITTWDGAKTL